MKTKVSTIDVSKAPPEVREFLGRFNVAEESVLFKDGDRPVAALVSPEEIRIVARAREELLEMLEEVAERNREVSMEEIETDVEEAIRAVRSTV